MLSPSSSISCVTADLCEGAVSPDHVHMRVVTPPWLSPAKQVQFLKGRSSRMLQRDFQHLHKRYWGNTCVPRHFDAAVQKHRAGPRTCPIQGAPRDRDFVTGARRRDITCPTAPVSGNPSRPGADLRHERRAT